MLATDFTDYQARYKEISKSKRLPFDPSSIVIQLNMVIQILKSMCERNKSVEATLEISVRDSNYILSPLSQSEEVPHPRGLQNSFAHFKPESPGSPSI